MTSRLELEAFASMMVVSLPYPPLPVVCLRGPDSSDSFASGHDLLGSAIMSMVVGHASSCHASVEVRQRKEAIVLKLNDDISKEWGMSGRSLDESAVLTRCYDIFCTSFRQYMQCYPSSPDLRIADIESVCRDTTVVRQAIAHLKARRMTTLETDTVIPETLPDNYNALIRLYVEDLYSQSR